MDGPVCLTVYLLHGIVDSKFLAITNKVAKDIYVHICFCIDIFSFLWHKCLRVQSLVSLLTVSFLILFLLLQLLPSLSHSLLIQAYDPGWHPGGYLPPFLKLVWKPHLLPHTIKIKCNSRTQHMEHFKSWPGLISLLTPTVIHSHTCSCSSEATLGGHFILLWSSRTVPFPWNDPDLPSLLASSIGTNTISHCTCVFSLRA